MLGAVLVYFLIAGRLAGIELAVMPGLTGNQLAVKLTALYPHIKVLYASGYTENAIVHRGILNEGIDFIQKPYGAEELLAKITEILNRD